MFLRKNSLIVSVIYWLLAIILFPYLRYYIDNPDTFSYISISEKYANGDFSEGINGYWSPLICWLLAIPIRFNADPVVAFKVFQLLIGWFALIQWSLLTKRFLQNNIFRTLLTISAVPFLLSWSLLNLSSDLLFLSIILLYLNIVCKESFFTNDTFWLHAGIIGAALYLSKSFGFIFFIIHFSTIVFYQIFKQRDRIFRNRLINNYIVSMLCFLILTGGWIFLLSKKYHHFTIGETVSFNLSKEVAPTAEQKIELPILKGGLFIPINSTATNAWEDPGLGFKYTPLKPFSSSSDFQIYKKVLKRNFLTIYYYDFRRQVGSLFLIILLLFAVFSNKRKLLISFPFLSIILTVVLFYGMYGLILVHVRYVWICTLLMILIIVYLTKQALEQNTSKRANWFLKIFVFIVLLLAVKRPVKEIFFTEDKDLPIRRLALAIVHPFSQLQQTYQVDRNLFEATDTLSKIIKRGQRIASVKENNSVRDNYSRSSLMAFKTGAQYYGQVSANESRTENMQDSLNHFQINYILFWSNDSLSANGHFNQKKIYANEKISLQVFERSVILKP